MRCFRKVASGLDNRAKEYAQNQQSDGRSQMRITLFDNTNRVVCFQCQLTLNRCLRCN